MATLLITLIATCGRSSSFPGTEVVRARPGEIASMAAPGHEWRRHREGGGYCELPVNPSLPYEYPRPDSSMAHALALRFLGDTTPGAYVLREYYRSVSGYLLRFGPPESPLPTLDGGATLFVNADAPCIVALGR